MLQPEKKLKLQQLIFLKVLQSLTFKEMDILISRYFLGFNLSDIATRYKIDRERVRQIEKNALQKILIHSAITNNLEFDSRKIKKS